MTQISFSVDELVDRLLSLPPDRQVTLLDSGGRRELGSHLLITGIDPTYHREFSSEDPNETLAALDVAISDKSSACVFTISYEFGEKILGICNERKLGPEPDVCLSVFDVLVIHDYGTGETRLAGNAAKFDRVIRSLENAELSRIQETPESPVEGFSNFPEPGISPGNENKLRPTPPPDPH